MEIDRCHISIHSPYTGRDDIYQDTEYSNKIFQSTLPIQGETFSLPRLFLCYIHFNPLSLYRERPEWRNDRMAEDLFQSTLPIQGETEPKQSDSKPYKVFQSTLPIQGETSRE